MSVTVLANGARNDRRRSGRARKVVDRYGSQSSIIFLSVVSQLLTRPSLCTLQKATELNKTQTTTVLKRMTHLIV